MSDLQHGAPGDYDDPANGPIYEERRRLSPLVRMLVLAAIVVAVVALAGLVWFAYSEGVRSGAEEAAPVLRADPEPVKRKPEDAGGMNIPHQDKLIYDRIAPGQAQTSVERLLPPPESPLDRSTMPAEPPPGPSGEPSPAPATQPIVPPPPPAGVAQAPRVPAIEPPVAPAGPGVPPSAEPARDTPPASEGTPFVRTPEPPAPPPVAEPDPPAQQAAAPVPPPVSAVPPADTGPAWRVQLASLTSEDAAQQAWARMQKANADLLGGLSLNVQTATLAKGSYYRVQAGPLADRAAASALCSELKTRKQDCLVVAP